MTRVSLKTVHRLEFSWDLLDSKSIVELYVSRFFSDTFQISTVSATLASSLDSSLILVMSGTKISVSEKKHRYFLIFRDLPELPTLKNNLVSCQISIFFYLEKLQKKSRKIKKHFFAGNFEGFRTGHDQNQ